MTAEEREQKSAEADLKNAQDQAKEQRKKLQYAEIELATSRQQGLGVEGRFRKGQGGCSDGQGDSRGCGAGILIPRGVGD